MKRKRPEEKDKKSTLDKETSDKSVSNEDDNEEERPVIEKLITPIPAKKKKKSGMCLLIITTPRASPMRQTTPMELDEEVPVSMGKGKKKATPQASLSMQGDKEEDFIMMDDGSDNDELFVTVELSRETQMQISKRKF